MDQPPKWLAEAAGTPWETLASAMRSGFPVPNGFVVFPGTSEGQIREAYEEQIVREKTHFLAIRSPSHAVLNMIGADQLIHTLRRFRSESPESPILVQRMVPSIWCGKAQWHRKNLRIRANEGMLLLDPDTYLLNTTSGKCIRKTLEPKQRKMIRYVDGTTRTVEREGERNSMTSDQLKSVADLAERARADITWAIDDQDRVWLISLNDGKTE
ncbi:MAG TPA: hypothetical protein VE422_01245 [Terriglobia bacterium]|nr:hypothetical protein [Terriglobia bacterium]